MAEAIGSDGTIEATDFEILKKWVTWTVSPNPEAVDGYDQNAVHFGMLVRFLDSNGDIVGHKTLQFDRSVVDGVQEDWNTLMENASNLTAAQLATKQKVIEAIRKERFF